MYNTETGYFLLAKIRYNILIKNNLIYDCFAYLTEGKEATETYVKTGVPSKIVKRKKKGKFDLFRLYFKTILYFYLM